VLQAPSPEATETATAHANAFLMMACLIMAKTSSDPMERGATQ
jgi:hypothetical protein